MNAQTSKKGFTIIEVVLVLAIAALIFLMIFIALPALQRGQRDTARKQDVGAVASALNTYRSNHRGTLPAAGGFPTGYVDKLSQVDTAELTVVVATAGATGPADVDAIIAYTQGKCNDDNTVATTTSKRQAAVVTKLENGGAYCQDV